MVLSWISIGYFKFSKFFVCLEPCLALSVIYPDLGFICTSENFHFGNIPYSLSKPLSITTKSLINMPSFSRESRSSHHHHRHHPETQIPTHAIVDVMNPPSIYYVQPEEEVEIEVIGHHFRISHFNRVESEINFHDLPERDEAYYLMYQYFMSPRSLFICSVYFVGGKPDIHILLQDDRYPSTPIPEYRIVSDETTHVPRLRLIHPDARRDPQRTSPNDEPLEPPAGFAINTPTV
jgi:hypothetical protein